MTTIQYIQAKNKILFDLSGITLVPESQMMEIPITRLYLDSDSSCCTYCRHFVNCVGCPMYLAGNDCDANHSTYNQVRDKLKILELRHIPAIHDLVNQYNEELPDGI